jgi:hypothetical protein
LFAIVSLCFRAFVVEFVGNLLVVEYFVGDIRIQCFVVDIVVVVVVGTIEFDLVEVA